MSITEFLLARIAEDARAVEIPDWYCTYSARGEGWGSRGEACDLCGAYMFDGTEAATKYAWAEHLESAHGRQLREVEAKQRILSQWSDPFGQWAAEQADAAESIKDGVLRRLASIYADHPDYREEWKS